MHWWFSWVCFAFWPQVLTFSGSTAQGLNLTWREVSPQLVGAMVFSHQPWPVTLINPSWPKYWKEKLRGGRASCKRDHLETFINMPVFPRSPKDSRKIVKMKREVPVAQFHLSWGAPCICSKKERALAPKPCPTPHEPATKRWTVLWNTFSFGLSKVRSYYIHVSLIYDKCW